MQMTSIVLLFLISLSLSHFSLSLSLAVSRLRFRLASGKRAWKCRRGRSADARGNGQLVCHRRRESKQEHQHRPNAGAGPFTRRCSNWDGGPGVGWVGNCCVLQVLLVLNSCLDGSSHLLLNLPRPPSLSGESLLVPLFGPFCQSVFLHAMHSTSLVKTRSSTCLN